MKKILTLFSFLFVAVCCTNEYIYTQSEEKDSLQINDFFYYKKDINNQSRCINTSGSNLDKSINLIFKVLQKRKDINKFITKCKQSHGIPIWNKSILVFYESHYVMYVPIQNKNKKEVESIWFFWIDNNDIYHYILKRPSNTSSIEKTWMFDYFTFTIYDIYPSSGLKFKNISSRAESSVECVHAYIEIGGIEYDKGIHCWEEGGGGLGAGDFDYPEDTEILGPEHEDITEETELPHGGSSTETDSKETYSDGDPCKLAKEKKNDIAFKNRVQELFITCIDDEIVDSEKLEDGWILDSQGKIIRPDKRTNNSCNYSTELINGKIYQEWYHTHPCSMVPSPADLYKLGFTYNKGRINPENFSYGIISRYGIITLVISSIDSFNLFYKKMSDDSVKNEYNTIVGGTRNFNEAIKELTKYLKNNNSGLNVISCPTNETGENLSWENYKVQNYTNDKLVDYNCEQ